jgi:spermidine/putrescine-binding protein
MTITRRSFIRAGTAAGALTVSGGLSALLTACGNPNDGRIKFYNWQDYVDRELLTKFEDESDIVVSYSTYASNDELGDRLALAGVPRRGNRAATSFDLIVPSENLFRRLLDQDRLQEFDQSVVTEALLANLAPEFRALAVDPGNRYGVPWATGSTGIGYDTTVFAEPPSWEVFLDAAQAGKLSLLDEKREAFAAAQFSLGIDPNTTDPAEIDAATERLTEMRDNARFDSETYLDSLIDGSLVAAQAFSSDIVQAQRENPDLAFVIPDAGGSRWIDLLCIPADAPNADGANAFVAFMLDPGNAAQNAGVVGADPGNAPAREQVRADVVSNPAAFPPAEVVDRLVFLEDLGDDEELLNTAWDQVRG